MKIAICTPVKDSLEPEFAISLSNTIKSIEGAEIIWLPSVGHANVPRARNYLVARALEENCDDIVFIDDDIGWKAEEFAKLFQVPSAARIVAGVPQRRAPEEISFCGMPDFENAKKLGPLVSGHAATAFLRVKAEVFRELKYPEEYDYRGTPCKSWFMYHVGPNPSGKTVGLVGEDYHFSMRCKEEGEQVWLRPDIRLRHHTKIALDACLDDHLTITTKEEEAA